MSEKSDGSMKIFPNGRNEGNRNNFFTKIGIEESRVFSADLTHSNNVQKVFPGSPKVFPDTDALVTDNSRSFLSVTVADCLPIMFYEEGKKIVGIAHAGWRGLLNGIIENTIAEIISLGGSPDNLQVVIGPAISKCNFEVQKDILDNFKEYNDFIEEREAKYFVDLRGIAKNKITGAGIVVDNIKDADLCTYTETNLFSYRRDKPEVVEAGIVLIGIL